MTAKKRYIVRSMHLDEISTVDRPAQTGAVCVLIKRAGETIEEVSFTTICKSAEAIVDGGKPTYTRQAYEDAMFLRAEGLAKNDRITPEQALAKYLTTDATLRQLAYASEVANAAEYGARFRRQAAA